MTGYDNAVQSLINGGYPERQAKEILSLALGEAQQQGFEAGRRAARAEALANAADELREMQRQEPDHRHAAGLYSAELRIRDMAPPTASGSTAGDEQAEVTLEYGIYTLGRDRAIGVTLSRAEADDTLITVRASHPGAVMVQRTVRYGEWTEVTR
jgi:hypothetical protein